MWKGASRGVDHVTYPLTPDHIDGHMRLFKAQGVSRISWSYYADERGGQIYPYDPADTRNPFPGWRNIVDTYHRLGNPLRVAAEAAHRHGLEIHGNFKPYETGCGHPFPAGSPAALAYLVSGDARFLDWGAWRRQIGSSTSAGTPTAPA